MAGRLEVADVFRRFGGAWRAAQDGHLDRGRRRVMAAIEACRTARLGGHTESCGECGLVRIAYNSCRNRHCPKCQGLARAQWLADRQAELLPVPYFHVVFTVPAEIAVVAFHNKAVVYDILFKATNETLRTIAADPKHLGAELGFVTVLHTWGQALQHHPHLHCVVPAGGLSPDGQRWVACRPGFFLPVKVLSRLFRRLFLEQLKAAFDAGKLAFFFRLRCPRRTRRFHPLPCAAAQGELGSLRQAPVRRTRASAGLSRSLYPPGCHRQQPIERNRGWGCQLPLEGLSPSRQAEGDDAEARRIHPPLLAPRPPRRLPPHPPLRLSRQWAPRRQAGNLPPPAGRADAADRGGRHPG